MVTKTDGHPHCGNKPATHSPLRDAILVRHFTEIFTYIKIQMSKLKCQMNIKAQSLKRLTPISILDIW